jgi:hypothetical protein
MFLIHAQQVRLSKYRAVGNFARLYLMAAIAACGGSGAGDLKVELAQQDGLSY